MEISGEVHAENSSSEGLVIGISNILADALARFMLKSGILILILNLKEWESKAMVLWFTYMTKGNVEIEK